MAVGGWGGVGWGMGWGGGLIGVGQGLDMGITMNRNSEKTSFFCVGKSMRYAWTEYMIDQQKLQKEANMKKKLFNG